MKKSITPKRSQQSLTSTNDLEEMIDDYKDEIDDDINIEVSFNYIEFPIEKKVNCYIVNLYSYENIDKEIGHWITIITKNTNAIVYTCFGLYSKTLLGALGKMGYKEVVFDLTPNQRLNSKSCGFYCLRYIIDREWKDMTDYLWFVRDNSTSNENFENWDTIEDLSLWRMDLNIRPDIRDKIKKNNDVYRRSLKH